jgi:drug/metabolite transporter (DMT)-like permease
MQDDNNKHIVIGYLCAVAATLFWSGNFTVARGMTENIPPVSLAFWRWTTAVILLTPIAIKFLIKDWQAIKNNLSYLTVTSILGVSLFNTLIYIAGHTTTAVNLSLIAITFPVFIIVISRFLYNEAITINKWLGILLVIAGVVTLITKGDFLILKDLRFARGDLWMLLAAITFAIYSILVKHKPAELGTRSFQLSTFLLGLLFLTPFYIWESSTTDFQIQSINNNTFYSILYLGLFASLFSYFLWGKAVENIGPTKSSIIYYTLPIFSGILAFIILGEKIESIHLLSMLLILIGVLVAIYRPKPN